MNSRHFTGKIERNLDVNEENSVSDIQIISFVFPT